MNTAQAFVIKLEQLKLCPFCAKPPEVLSHEQHQEGDVRTVYTIRCCVSMVEPGRWGYRRDGDVLMDSVARFNLVQRWNGRAGDVVFVGLTDAELAMIYEYDHEDGWCGHDVTGESLKAIFNRVFDSRFFVRS